MIRVRRRLVPLAAAVLLLPGAGALARDEHTICEVQEYDDQGLSPLEGQIVTVRGVVTFPPGQLVAEYTSMYIEADGCGVNVFCYDQLTAFELALGDSVIATGEVEEYIDEGVGATTEVVCRAAADIDTLSTGHPEPEPAEMDIEEAAVEDSEGRLVRTFGEVVSMMGDWKMTLADLYDADQMIDVYQAYNDSVTLAPYAVGDTLEITGVVSQYDETSPYFDGYQLIPRYQRDIVHWVPPPPPPPVFAGEASMEVTAKPFYPDVGEILPIVYAAPDESHTVMTIYDLQGRVVRTLLDCCYDGQSGLPRFYSSGVRGWDGRDDLKRLVPIGTYVLRLEVTDTDGTATTEVAPAVVGAKLR